MQNPEEHYHVAVPLSYEDLQDEKYQPFPPPMSPVFAQLPRKRPPSSGSSTDDIGGETIGGILLSQMEEEPVTVWRDPEADLDVDKLLSEKGICSLWSALCNTSFKGEGYEVEDLHTLLGEIESWACQLYPQHTFDDLVSQFENIGDRPDIQGSMRGLQQGRVMPGGLEEAEDQACERAISTSSDSSDQRERKREEGHLKDNDSAIREGS